MAKRRRKSRPQVKEEAVARGAAASLTPTATRGDYTTLWSTMEVADDPQVTHDAQTAIENKERYLAVQAMTRVPWPVIACAHMRESTFDFDTYLGNGEPLGRTTRTVPKGRGPFKTWEAGAVDALRYDDLDDLRPEDWTIEGAAYALEKLNGFGYRNKGINSPYLWSKSNHYSRGKYTGDGSYSSGAVDKQTGCMPMLKRMMALDASITFPPGVIPVTPEAHPDAPKDIQTRLAEMGLLDPPSDGVIGSVSRWALAKAGITEIVTATNANVILDKLKELPELALEPKDDLAGRIVSAMRQRDYWVCRHRDCFNIVYIEGMNEDGSVNANTPNQFNDLRILIQVVNGTPKIVGQWQATTEPSKYWTLRPMNSNGAARIAFGQWKSWTVGIHNGSHEALVQVAPLTVYRDKNKDFSRLGDMQDTGLFGVNQHWGYDLPKDDLGQSSAGCLVGRMKQGHREFMAAIKSDARYKASGGSYKFMTTVMPAHWTLKE